LILLIRVEGTHMIRAVRYFALAASLSMGGAARLANATPIVDQWSLVPEAAPWSSASTAANEALAQTLLIGTTGILSTVGLELWHLGDSSVGRGDISVEVRQMRRGNNPAGDLVASGRIVDTGFIPTAGAKGTESLPVPLTLVDISSARYLTTYGERLSIVVKATGAYAWKTIDESAASGGGDYYPRGNPYARSSSVWSEGTADFGFATFVDPARPGDVNLDGEVDLADFGVLKTNFGAGARRIGGDLTGDGLVGLADFGELKANFGKSAAAAVPEPAGYAAWAGLCFAGLLVDAYRRRVRQS
jgi:hypothetical protein